VEVARVTQRGFDFGGILNTPWTPPKISELPSWADAARVSVDIETCDPQLDDLGPGWYRGDAYVAGIAFAIEDGPAHYLPIRHAGGDNLDVDHALAYLRDQARDFRGEIAGAQLGYDIAGLEHDDIVFAQAAGYRDCLVNEPLIDPLQHTYGLDDVLRRRGLPGKDETLLREAMRVHGLPCKTNKQVKQNLHRLPGRYVAPYAVRDVRGPLQLLRRQERDIEDQDLDKAATLEAKVLPVCHEMRKRGQRVDLDRVDQIATWALREEQAAMSEFSRLVGGTFTEADTMRGDALGPVIERATGVPLPRTERTGKISVTAKILAALEHPVGVALRRARVLNKIRTTFCAQVREGAVRHGDEWRVHCTFNQVRVSRDGEDDEKGARTFRLSSTDFNKQNQPNRSDIAVTLPDGRTTTLGTWWRTVFLADKGKRWISCDYSQQEPRIECHFAVKRGLRGARKWQERWIQDPRMSVHKIMAKETGLDIKTAKQLRLALGYNMGGAKTCHEYLKLPTKWITREWGDRKGEPMEVAGEEGQAFIDRFDREAPYIKLLSKEAQRIGKERGYVVCLGGHHFQAPPGDDRLYGNGLIQCSAAGQTKLAMVRLHEMGVPLQDQIHDELNWSEDDLARARAAKREMEEVIKLEVPVFVALEEGDNWGELTEVPEAA
jgi:DNA polymerase I-like protein with 3'-5' exonuclease and polymerase domains